MRYVADLVLASTGLCRYVWGLDQCELVNLCDARDRDCRGPKSDALRVHTAEARNQWSVSGALR